jgi:enoyl-CoA hydratase
MSYDNLLVDVDGAVATITLNRPHALNALSGGLMDDYEAALAELNAGDSVHVIRLKGAGRAFCSGYDIAAPLGATGGYLPSAAPATTTEQDPPLAAMGEGFSLREREGLRLQAERWLRLWNYRKPVIAQVHGYCLSGGLDLLATTDLAFAATGTRFGHPASRAVGIPVILGMLPLKIGASKTKHLLFTGDYIEAGEAREWGLVDRVFDPEELDERTLAYCRRVALVPTEALAIHKHVVNRWSEVMGARTASYESVDFDVLYHTTPAYHEFIRRIMKDGLQSALAWRDNPFKETAQP